MLRLQSSVLMMSSLADRNFALSVRSLLERNSQLAEVVVAEDAQLDELEISVDDQIIKYMSTRSPVATDCRFMLVASKIARNLEEVADQTVTIARRARQLNKLPAVPFESAGFQKMALLAASMCQDGITALVQEEPDRVDEIVARDKELDAQYKEISKQITRTMTFDTNYVEGLIHWLFVAKAIERIGDYAKNTAQEVHYLYRAIDIRHGIK